MSKIAIIGAGIAGLTASYELNKKGHQTTIYEKSDYPGGRTYTYQKGSVSLNTGAVFFTNFYSPFFEYLQENNFLLRFCTFLKILDFTPIFVSQNLVVQKWQ